MSFVNIDQIRPFIPRGIYNALNTAIPDGEQTYFEDVVAAADIIIRDKTGRDIPASEDDAPDWIIVPAAHIIAKLSLHMLSEVTPEFYDRVEKDYENAILTLMQHPEDQDDDPPDLSGPLTGTISGMISW